LLRLVNESIQRNQNMRDDLMQATLAAWATKDLPARLDVVATAKLLGFAEHDIQILMAAGKLEPLGDPPNAPKWFVALEVIGLAADRDWLNRIGMTNTPESGALLRPLLHQVAAV
jgi:hypothetical protein